MLKIEGIAGVRKIVKAIGKNYSRVPNLMVLLGGIPIVLMMFYVSIDVARRFFVSKTMPATQELSLIFMIYIVYWAFAGAQMQGRNLRMDFLAKKFSLRWQAALNCLGALIGLFLFILITWQGLDWAIEAWRTGEQMEGAARIPYFPARIGLTIGAFFLCIQFIIDAVTCARSSMLKGSES